MTADEDVQYQTEFEIDVENMNPLVACPHSMDNVKEVREVRGLPVHQALLSSCTNGRIEDLKQAAEILQDHQVHPDVRLIVIPASQKIYLEATRLGLTEIFLRAGAAIMLPSCASCAGNGPGVIASGERCFSTTNRNWKGRMGSPESEVFLASPYTVAASAVAGVIEDGSKYL
jgi:homoaconitase/3-isopropylmalate dehydratase large subunit